MGLLKGASKVARRYVDAQAKCEPCVHAFGQFLTLAVEVESRLGFFVFLGAGARGNEDTIGLKQPGYTSPSREYQPPIPRSRSDFRNPGGGDQIE